VFGVTSAYIGVCATFVGVVGDTGEVGGGVTGSVTSGGSVIGGGSVNGVPGGG